MAGRADDLTLTVSPAPTFLVCYPFRSSEWLAEFWLAGCSSEGHVPITCRGPSQSNHSMSRMLPGFGTDRTDESRRWQHGGASAKRL